METRIRIILLLFFIWILFYGKDFMDWVLYYGDKKQNPYPVKKENYRKIENSNLVINGIGTTMFMGDFQ